ncbi:MAG: WYL domain-containing protein [Gammaproteobacteria bacterium]|nr:WYL domain-containing protein [Gammaproteobacteria bacterium]
MKAQIGASGVSSALIRAVSAAGSRRVLPLAIIYYVHAMLLVSWCELRADFRHFRLDRILACSETDAGFKGQGDRLRERWKLVETD